MRRAAPVRAASQFTLKSKKKPANVQTPTPDAPSTEYLSFLMGTQTTLTDYTEKFNGYNAAMANDISLLYDDAWLDNIATYLFSIQSSCQGVIDYDEALVPEDCKEMHGEYKTGCQLYYAAMDTYIDGVDFVDTGLLNQANNRMREAIAHINNAASSFNQRLKEGLFLVDPHAPILSFSHAPKASSSPPLEI